MAERRGEERGSVQGLKLGREKRGSEQGSNLGRELQQRGKGKRCLFNRAEEAQIKFWYWADLIWIGQS
jgi:hypothetical protein